MIAIFGFCSILGVMETQLLIVDGLHWFAFSKLKTLLQQSCILYTPAVLRQSVFTLSLVFILFFSPSKPLRELKCVFVPTCSPLISARFLRELRSLPPPALPRPRRVLSPARRACPANTTRRLAHPRRSISEDGVKEVARRGRWMTSSRLPFVPPVRWLLCITWITEHTLPVGRAHTLSHGTMQPPHTHTHTSADTHLHTQWSCRANNQFAPLSRSSGVHHSFFF